MLRMQILKPISCCIISVSIRRKQCGYSDGATKSVYYIDPYLGRITCYFEEDWEGMLICRNQAVI